MSKFIVQLCRVLVGGLFIFSGLIKANDPVGFAVKLEDYFLVFGEAIPFFSSPFIMGLTLPLAAFIVVLEVGLGIALLLGIQRKPVAVMLLGMILFFTWLTGFSAITGKVTDCGCFGDAIPLTPWESFQKDIVLTVLILVIFIDIFFSPKVIKPLFSATPRWAMFLGGVLFTSWVSYAAINHLPFIDFRPYKVGNNIRELMQLPPDAKQEIREITWTYKNKATGEVQTFTPDPPKDLENWEYVGRDDVVVQEADHPKIHDYIFTDMNGDLASEKLRDNPDYNFYIISPEPSKTKQEAWKKFNAVQQAAAAEGIVTTGLMAATPEEIEAFKVETGADYGFLSGDLKGLKTMIRTNPGVMLVKDATIIDKWAWKDVPSFDKIKAAHFSDRAPTTLPSDEPEAIFNVGDNLPALISAGAPNVSEFFATDADGADATETILTTEEASYAIIVRDIFEVTKESFAEFKEAIAFLNEREKPYYILTGAAAEDFAGMYSATGTAFNYYFCDAELLEKIMPDNFGLLLLENGVVKEKLPLADLNGE